MDKIKIPKSLLSQLPADQREGLANFLWDKSHGFCYLCDRPINLATDDIDIDHDQASSAGGPTNRSNINLAHRSCNRAKSNYPTGDIRPFLRLKAFAHEHGNVISYEDVQAHFNISAKESVLEWTPGNPVAKWHLPNACIIDSPVFTETDGREAIHYYTFLEVPREAIFNDNECQPRSIKLGQAWAIYVDIENNPIHEPPSCRIIHGPGGSVKLAMFDGQHKSVALWMHGRQSVVVKVYLTITKEETIRLVGSIQSRIKKLPLSSFESALKMGEEWTARVEEYENRVGIEEASETGLIESLVPQDRKRAKDAFASQLIKEVLELDDLKILQFVQRAGRPKQPHHLITETAFKNKVVSNLRHMNPIPDKGDLRERARARELENITFALDSLADAAFLNKEGGLDLSKSQLERRDRMKYQASLAYIAMLIRRLFRQILIVDDEPRALLEKEPTDEQRQRIRAGIQRIADHPIWTCDWDQSPATRAVKEALTKNQDAADAFRAVELRGEYVNGVEPLPGNWAKDQA